MDLRAQIRRLLLAHRSTQIAEAMASHTRVAPGDAATGPSGANYQVVSVMRTYPGMGRLNTTPTASARYLVCGDEVLSMWKGLGRAADHQTPPTGRDLHEAGPEARQRWVADAPEVVEHLGAATRARSGLPAPPQQRLNPDAGHITRQVRAILGG